MPCEQESEKPRDFALCPGCAKVLNRVASDEVTRPGDARKAAAILKAANHVPNTTLAREVGASPTSTANWRTAFGTQGLAFFAHRKEGSGRPGEIPGLELARIADALTRNEHSPAPLSTRALAVRLGVSTATLTRVRADLRISHGGEAPPRHHLVEVVGVLLQPGLCAVAVALDPSTNAAFRSMHRAPHMDGICSGALVAAMGGVDVLRERLRAQRLAIQGERGRAASGGAEASVQRRSTQSKAGGWEGAALSGTEEAFARFIQDLALQWPTGAHLHVIAGGDIGGIQQQMVRQLPGRRPALLRIRHTNLAAWQHERMTMMARVVRAAGSRENFACLEDLLREIDRAIHRGKTIRRFRWIAPRMAAEQRARRSRSDLIERTRGF